MFFIAFYNIGLQWIENLKEKEKKQDLSIGSLRSTALHKYLLNE